MAKAQREVNGRYARYRNALDATSGHVWQNRYYSCPFRASRLAAVMRYVPPTFPRSHVAPNRIFFRPAGLAGARLRVPSAHALGYSLAPLAGLVR